MRIMVTFSLNDDKDHDLIRWYKDLPKGDKSEAIRQTLRAGLGRAGLTLGDVYQAVKELERKLQGGAVHLTEIMPEAEDNAPADAIANLDSLGL